MRVRGFYLWRMPKKLLAAAAVLAALAGLAGLSVGGVQMVAAQQESIELPAVMYHHILDDPALLGDYVISPGQLESDLQYIQQQGYTAVLPHEVAAWARGQGELPEKPILITFDDGNKSAYVYAYPLLQKAGMKAALSVIGIHSEKYSEIDDGNVRYAHVTWDELAELQDSGVFEIGNHTYNMHEESAPRSGILRRKGESSREYQDALRRDLDVSQKLLAGALGAAPKVFAYPYGFIEPDAEKVLGEMGFEVTLGVEEKVNTIRRGDPESLKRLGRFNRPYSAATAAFFDRMFAEDGEKFGKKGE